jgi:hypothetical protein
MQEHPNPTVKAVAKMLMTVMDMHILQANEIYASAFKMNPGLHYRIDILIVDNILRCEVMVEPQNTRSN